MTSLHRNLRNIPCQPQLTKPQAQRMQGVENPLLNHFPLGSNLSEWGSHKLGAALPKYTSIPACHTSGIFLFDSMH